MEQETNAAEMAREAGVDDKRFRARLRTALAAHHEFGSWRVIIGSDKHRLMTAELAAMQREDAAR